MAFGYYSIENAVQSFKIERFCAFKYCTSCKDLDTCDACVEGLEWNAQEKKCAVKVAVAKVF